MRINTDAPRNVDVCIVDGIFLVQSHVDSPTTFGGVANVTLSRLVRHPNRVECACDTYKLLYISICDIAREDHGLILGEVNISGPESACQKSLLKL